VFLDNSFALAIRWMPLCSLEYQHKKNAEYLHLAIVVDG